MHITNKNPSVSADRDTSPSQGRSFKKKGRRELIPSCDIFWLYDVFPRKLLSNIF